MTLGRVPVADETPRPIREVRWSARRKMEVVLRLLRGESLETVSREVESRPTASSPGGTSSWRPARRGLKARPRAPDERRLADAERKVGELPIELEVWRAAARKRGSRSGRRGPRGERRDRVAMATVCRVLRAHARGRAPGAPAGTWPAAPEKPHRDDHSGRPEPDLGNRRDDGLHRARRLGLGFRLC